MRILHVFRSPVGGLFRHVRDLARGQAELGHAVGLFCDSSTGGGSATTLLAAAQPFCSAGIATAPIARLPAPSDLKAIATCRAISTDGRFDILHGHGAKGGLIARIVGRKLGIPSLYTPHGGSLHYNWTSPMGAVFLSVEKALGYFGSGLVFVCEHERRTFTSKIGLAGKPSIVAHNGLWPEEFTPIAPASKATDLLFVGEVRHLKGIDLLFEAMRQLQPQSKLTLTVVGDGPELAHHQSLAQSMGLGDVVHFAGRLPIHQALPLGRIMVVPSRHESFPYVVLEAAAAGLPVIASNVGGIPEMLPAENLCEANSDSLAKKLVTWLSDPALQASARRTALSIKDRFSAGHMAQKITAFYTTLQS